MRPLPARPGPVRHNDGLGHLIVVLPQEFASVGVARSEVKAFVERSQPPAAQVADVVLVVSELVTNALRHGLGDVVPRCSVANGVVHVAVTDSGPELPVVQEDDRLRIGGVGLRIVDRLAERWGVASFPGVRSVWATVVATAR